MHIHTLSDIIYAPLSEMLISAQILCKRSKGGTVISIILQLERDTMQIKNIAVSAAIVAALAFAGCAKKEEAAAPAPEAAAPAPEATPAPAPEATPAPAADAAAPAAPAADAAAAPAAPAEAAPAPAAK
jgi:hypothetical protein